MSIEVYKFSNKVLSLACGLKITHLRTLNLVDNWSITPNYYKYSSEYSFQLNWDRKTNSINLWKYRMNWRNLPISIFPLTQVHHHRSWPSSKVTSFLRYEALTKHVSSCFIYILKGVYEFAQICNIVHIVIR